ncbi:MAG TPA: hypothetical protein VGF72_04820 [Gaiellaceae bacterium]
MEGNCDGCDPGVRCGASPRPVERVEHHPGSDRVAGDVAVSPNEIVVVFDSAGQRVGAEEVRRTSVANVVLARVAAVESLQAACYPRVRRVDQKMVMVRHQDVRHHAESERREGRRQMVEEGVSIDVVDEQDPVVAPMAGDVIDPFCVLPRRTTHRRHGRRRPARNQVESEDVAHLAHA